MPFFLQDPFNFNIEISVSWCGCRYHDPAGFMPRTLLEVPGAPPIFMTRDGLVQFKSNEFPLRVKG